MTLIIRRAAKKSCCHWVRKDAAGQVASSGQSYITEDEARTLDTFDSVFDAQAANPVLAQVEAVAGAIAAHDRKWDNHDLRKIYRRKAECVEVFRDTGVAATLLVAEAAARGVTVSTLADMIEAKANVDQAMEDAEVVRIVEKLALPV